ncbi:MAG TPA: choice-of-anchor tandem repeat GloVer-containing protein [Opitutaceae bacterium]|jgi:uncharacterized repeat protein (TIGR03803 family)|nr:choice-of-anchor tandem repeat GloVer-containing protein [Opitutaceae bacterium]
MITKLPLVRRVILLAGIFSAGSALATPQVATPNFSPAAGVYANAQSVTITSATSGASIVYTTDGSIPTVSGGTVTHGALYSGPITVGDTTLSAIAFANGYSNSAMAISGYTLQAVSDSEILPLITLPNSNVLYSFPVSATDGNTPAVALIQGSDGNFYGMTSAGGASNLGTIFKITPAGVLTTLVSFSGTSGASLGSAPHGSLVQGSDGNFYGTTQTGGTTNLGTVFKMTPAGVFTTLVTFSSGANGQQPFAGLVQGTDGNFYGSTELGGGSSNGTIFKMTSAGSLTTLLSFDGVSNGREPKGNLIQGTDGNFYGSTVFGVTGNSNGTIFKITPAGVLTTLYSFSGTDGALPQGNLLQGTDGNFYGITSGGGSSSDGTVFKMTPTGSLTTLVTFTGPNGAFPRSNLVQGTDGNIYGATNNGGSSYVSPSTPGIGTIFSMTTTGVLTTLLSSSSTSGSDPFGLVQATDGNFYTVTQTGGTSNVGAFIQLPMVAAPTFSPSAGTYTSAQTVTISTTTSGASIRYTIDGSTPTETTGTLYSTPVSISATTTLKAIAFLTGDLNSLVTSGTYTINIPTQAPAASSGGGGGGATSYWFLGFLALAGILRWKLRKKQASI